VPHTEEVGEELVRITISKIVDDSSTGLSFGRDEINKCIVEVKEDTIEEIVTEKEVLHINQMIDGFVHILIQVWIDTIQQDDCAEVCM
jgi:uncharacterized FlaG/YvyC family protein